MHNRRISQRERDLRAALHAERAQADPDADRIIALLQDHAAEMRVSLEALLDDLDAQLDPFTSDGSTRLG